MTSKPLLTKNMMVFFIILVFFWFGVIFYDFIADRFGFTFTDELIALFCIFCFVYFRIIKQGKIKTVSFVILSIIIFYFVYSLSIKSNSSKAIISDLCIISKPFIAILLIWELNPNFSNYMRKAFSISSLIASIYIAIVGFLGNSAIIYMFGHPSRLATASIISAFLYFISNKINKRTVLLFTLILSISLLSFCSKAYGLFIITVIPLWFLYRPLLKNTFRFKKRYSVTFLVLFVMIIISAWPKIYFYFITGTENPENMFARPALYLTSLKIAKDYFPFGSGLASYASHFSAAYYSSIYHQYGLAHLHGLSEDMPSFISDSFFPQVLGQFGFAGFLFFIGGFFLVIRNAYKWYLMDKKGAKYLYVVYCMIACIGIESVADSTFVQNRGMFIMMLLGLAMQKLRYPIAGH